MIDINFIQTSFTYNADRVVGNGSFGVVFQVNIFINKLIGYRCWNRGGRSNQEGVSGQEI